LEDWEIDGRIILKWIFKDLFGEFRLNWPGSGKGMVAGCCEGGNVYSGSVKCEFLH
jgi:hypothetical protein